MKEPGGCRFDKAARVHIGPLTGLVALVIHWNTDEKMPEHWILVS